MGMLFLLSTLEYHGHREPPKWINGGVSRAERPPAAADWSEGWDKYQVIAHEYTVEDWSTIFYQFCVVATSAHFAWSSTHWYCDSIVAFAYQK